MVSIESDISIFNYDIFRIDFYRDSPMLSSLPEPEQCQQYKQTWLLTWLLGWISDPRGVYMNNVLYYCISHMH